MANDAIKRSPSISSEMRHAASSTCQPWLPISDLRRAVGRAFPKRAKALRIQSRVFERTHATHKLRRVHSSVVFTENRRWLPAVGCAVGPRLPLQRSLFVLELYAR